MSGDGLDQLTTPDQRGPGLRLLVAAGMGLVLVLGVPLVVLGLVGIGTGIGQTMLCLGLVLLVSGAGGLGRELAERRHDRHPPQPRLVTTDDGEPALLLPRSTMRSRVSSWTLLGLAAVCALGAVLAGVHGSAGWAVVLAVVAVVLAAVAAPHRLADGAGGLWFTPQGIRHEHDGTRWRVAWDDVTGTVPHEPMPVMLRPDRMPAVERGLASGRRTTRARAGDLLLVETRYLAGGAALPAYVIDKALTDRGFRAALGSPESLPPSASRTDG